MNRVVSHNQRQDLRTLLTVELEETHIIESHPRNAVEDRRLVGVEVVVVKRRSVEKPCVLEVEKPPFDIGGSVGRDAGILCEMIEKTDVEISHRRRRGKSAYSIFQKVESGGIGLILTQ